MVAMVTGARYRSGRLEAAEIRLDSYVSAELEKACSTSPDDVMGGGKENSELRPSETVDCSPAVCPPGCAIVCLA